MLMFDRRLLSHFDWLLLLTTLSVVGVGVATVLSATYTPDRTLSPLAARQLAWAGAGLVGLLLVLLVDYRQLERYAYPIYGIALVLLILVDVMGSVGGGARRWLSIGPLSIQPSEPAKIATIIVLARFLHPRLGEGRLTLRSAIGPLLLVGIPAGLTLAQPDLGTALMFGFVVMAVLILAGLRLRWFLLAAAILGPMLIPAWHHLKPYQQQRILTFVDPQADPLGAGYHVLQSQIAIGSGMWSGKGYLRGTQNHLNFLPEQHTDFIFSVFAEEWGFVGACVLLGLYLALLARSLIAAARAKDNFGILLAFGISALLFFQVAINIGMASGVMPVVGITLPLFSYGGSSLLTMMVGIGLIMNVSMRRFTF